MARTELPIVVLDPTTALPVTGASCVILDRSTGSSAQVFPDETNATPISQPILTDTSGRLTGWVNRGRYQIQITISGRPSYSEFWDSSPAQDGGIDTAWLADSVITAPKLAAGSVTSASILNASIATADLALKSVDSTILANDASVDANRAVTTNHIKTAAVTGPKIADGSIGPNHLAANVLPLGTVIDWYRYATATTVPTGWHICDGAAWSTISNDLGATTGNIPNLINAVTVGARITTTSGGTTAADGIASTNGDTYANAPGIGGVGGSMAAVNLTHIHSYAHTHGVLGVDHLHGVGADGFHAHNITTGTATRGSPNGYAAGGGESVAFTNHIHGGATDAQGTHSHGGATGAADRSLNTSTYSQNTATTGAAQWTTIVSPTVVDLRPKHVGMLKIMKVRNS